MDRHPHSSSRGPSKRRHPAHGVKDAREDGLRKQSRHSRDHDAQDERRLQPKSDSGGGAAAGRDYRRDAADRGGSSGDIFLERRHYSQSRDKKWHQGHASRRGESTQSRETISRREAYDRPRNDLDRPSAPEIQRHRTSDGNRGQHAGHREHSSHARTEAPGLRRDRRYDSGSRDRRAPYSSERRRGDNYGAESRSAGRVEETRVRPGSERSRAASVSNQHPRQHYEGSDASRYDTSSRFHGKRSSTKTDRQHERDSLTHKVDTYSSDPGQTSHAQPRQSKESSPSMRLAPAVDVLTSKVGDSSGYGVARGVIKDLQLDETRYTVVNAATAGPNVSICSDVADKTQGDTNKVLVCGSVMCKLSVNFGPRSQNCRLLIGSGVYGDLTVTFAGGKDALVVIGNKCSLAGLKIHCNQTNDFVAIGSGVVCYGAKLVSGGAGAGSARPYIIIGDCCLVAAEVLLRNADSHILLSARGRQLNRPERGVLIEPHAWLGQRATVLKDVTIGRGSIVALGSLVNCDVPRGHTARGTPAQCYPLPSGANWCLNYSHAKRRVAQNFNDLFPAST